VEIFRDGTMELYYESPGWIIEDFQIDSQNNLLLSIAGREIHRVFPDGSEELLADRVNVLFQLDSKENLIAVEAFRYGQVIQKISPSGKISEYDQYIDLTIFTIGPNDEFIYVDQSGDMIGIDTDGVSRTISSGFEYQPSLILTPDGNIIAGGNGFFTKVDLATGEKTTIEWLRMGSGFPWEGIFDSQGELILSGGNEGMYRVNFLDQTVDQIRSHLGNTSAMTVDENGTILLAYGDAFPMGTTTLYSVIDGELSAIGTVPGGGPTSITSQDVNTLYVSISDTVYGNQIYRFNRQTGMSESIYSYDEFGIESLVINPSSSDLWWSSSQEAVFYLDASGNLITIPVPVENPGAIFLDIGADGSVYAIIWELRQDFSPTGKHALYRLNDDLSWEYIVDMSTDDPGIVLSLPVVCPDGTVYSIASVDGKTVGREHPSFNAVMRLNDNNTFELIAYDASIDGKAAICHPGSGNIYFTHYYGVYELVIP
jgi:hypothetical protein